MKYLILGGSGHTSKIAAEKLLAAGKDVTVLGRSASNLAPLASQGAKTLVGSLEDGAFLEKAFAGFDAVYAIIPPNMATPEFRKYQNVVADNIINALKVNKTSYLVFLSSVGAHLGEGAGVVDGLADFEKKLSQVPGINAKILRPGFFYYNFFSQIPMIKGMGIMGANYGPDIVIPFTSTEDIGEVAAEELLSLSFTGISVRYISSQEATPQEAASVIGKAIGKPDLKWVQFPDDQFKAGMLQAGLQENLVDGYVQLGQAFQVGKGQDDYVKHKPTLGKTKLEDFAKTFAHAFNA